MKKIKNAKQSILKKALAMIMMVTCVIGMAFSVNAETLSMSASGTADSSPKTSSDIGTQYYVKLTSVSYNGMANNTFPYGASITANLHKSNGTTIGNPGTITAVNSPIYPSIKQSYRNTSGSFYIQLKNEYGNLGCTVGVTWTP